jgi:hypothetical protein
MGAFARRYRDFLLIAVIAGVLGLAVVAGPVVSAFVKWVGEPAQSAVSPVFDSVPRCSPYVPSTYVAASDTCEVAVPTAVLYPIGQGPNGPCPSKTMYYNILTFACTSDTSFLCSGFTDAHFRASDSTCVLVAKAHDLVPPSCPVGGQLVFAINPIADTCLYGKPDFRVDVDWGTGVRVAVGGYVGIVLLVLSARALRRT